MNIIELAKEAGLLTEYGFTFAKPELLERFAALVRAEREWVDLTDDDINKCVYAIFEDSPTSSKRKLVSAVIAAFKEKNK